MLYCGTEYMYILVFLKIQQYNVARVFFLQKNLNHLSKFHDQIKMIFKDKVIFDDLQLLYYNSTLCI